MKHFISFFLAVFVGVGALSASEAFVQDGVLKVKGLPKAGKVTERTYRQDLGLTELKLSNGMRVLLRPVGESDGEIFIHLFAPGGYAGLSREEWASAKLAGLVAWESGFDSVSKKEMRRYFARSGIDLRMKIRPQERLVEGSSDRRSLKGVFKALHLIFTSGEPKQQTLDQVKQHTAAVVENRGRDPLEVLEDGVWKVNTQEHYVFQHVGESEAEDLNLEVMNRFYQRCFGDPADFTLVLVGDFEEGRVIDLLERFVANIPSEAGFTEPLVPVSWKFPQEPKTISIEAGQSPVEMTRVTFLMENLSGGEDHTSLEVVCRILQKRIKERLVKEVPRSVAVRVGYEFPNYPDPSQVWLSIQLSAGKKDSRALPQIVIEEVQRLQAEGVSITSFHSTRDLLIKNDRFWSQDRDYWRWLLVTATYWGWDPAQLQVNEAQFKGVTVEEVNQFLQKKLHGERYTVVNLKRTSE